MPSGGVDGPATMLPDPLAVSWENAQLPMLDGRTTTVTGVEVGVGVGVLLGVLVAVAVGAGVPGDEEKTTRTRVFPASTRNRLLEPSNAAAHGALTCALVAGPESPANPHV